MVIEIAFECCLFIGCPCGFLCCIERLIVFCSDGKDTFILLILLNCNGKMSGVFYSRPIGVLWIDCDSEAILFIGGLEFSIEASSIKGAASNDFIIQSGLAPRVMESGCQ